MRFMFFKDRMCGFKDWAWVGFTRKENFGGVGIASRAIMGQSGLGVGTGRVFRCGRYFLCQSQLKKPHDIPFMHPSTISFATPFSLSPSHTHTPLNKSTFPKTQRGTRASRRNTGLREEHEPLFEISSMSANRHHNTPFMSPSFSSSTNSNTIHNPPRGTRAP